MSIQSSINAAIGSIAVVKKAHDYNVASQANQRMLQQRIDIARQRQKNIEYAEKTKRKRLNYEIKKQKEALNNATKA